MRRLDGIHKRVEDTAPAQRFQRGRGRAALRCHPLAQDAGTPAEPALPDADKEVAPAPESPAEPPAPRAEEAAPSQEKPGMQDATGTVAPQAASPFERHPVPLTERADARSSLPQVWGCRGEDTMGLMP